MESQETVSSTTGRAGSRLRAHAGGLAGYAGIWAFMALFLIYPLIRLFYDAFTTEDEVFTLLNFYDFFTDPFYLKALMNSLILGAATVVTTSSSGSRSPFCFCATSSPAAASFPSCPSFP